MLAAMEEWVRALRKLLVEPATLRVRTWREPGRALMHWTTSSQSWPSPVPRTTTSARERETIAPALKAKRLSALAVLRPPGR
jgi:hypothetical protein